MPPQNVSAATFTAPFKPAGAIHACSPAATFATAAPQRFFQFTVGLGGGAAAALANTSGMRGASLLHARRAPAPTCRPHTPATWPPPPPGR